MGVKLSPQSASKGIPPEHSERWIKQDAADSVRHLCAPAPGCATHSQTGNQGSESGGSNPGAAPTPVWGL